MAIGRQIHGTWSYRPSITDALQRHQYHRLTRAIPVTACSTKFTVVIGVYVAVAFIFMLNCSLESNYFKGENSDY